MEFSELNYIFHDNKLLHQVRKTVGCERLIPIGGYWRARSRKWYYKNELGKVRAIYKPPKELLAILLLLGEEVV